MDSQMTIAEWPGILEDPGLGGISFQSSVLDISAVTTRAGLYIYLIAVLHDRPSFDDMTVTTFLNVRYSEDIPSLVSDLILASFDVLANSQTRSESKRSRTIVRSFIVNKLPPFLQTNYASLIFEPLSIGHCIRQALGRIDPSFSQTYDFGGPGSSLSEARQEFLFACALHQLIPEESIADILEDVPMQSLPTEGKYLKEDLVRKCTADPAKIDQYVGELENLEGNAGEIAFAITEIIQTLCANNDTMTLKGICNTLSRKLTALDVLILFTHPVSLLQPLCHALDNWQDHEDQGEYQPVYDEFGSILLFVVVLRHRFKLLEDDLGIEKSDSFVLQYLRSASFSQPLNDLSQHSTDVLGSWIKGLFETTEGISDELLSTCKPSEFHLLVATLFDQSLKACQANALSLDTLKGGFEYLLEPFLLPSLIASLKWFSEQLWETQPQSPSLDVILLALSALLKPPSMSPEASIIHGAVLTVVAQPLEASFIQVQQRHPSRADIRSLLGVLADYTGEREDLTAYNQLASWSTAPAGGLLSALRSTINSLVLWSATSASAGLMSPPSYTHRLLRDCVQIRGAKATLDMLVAELLVQSHNLQNADIVFDIIVVMLTATEHQKLQPHQDESHKGLQPRLDLHEVLQSDFHDASELSSTDPARATMIVRLFRRVEAFSGRTAMVATTNPEFMNEIVQNVGAMPSNNIDDVLAQAEVQTAAAQDYLASENAALMGMA